ncbi:hypothetical protein ASPWEDRAFT_307610 [Aspergillus wentii DTO 134E9]|uniref:Uncharacterized protein n=1 Tax=Aspergillus wentii DTO 134E9 TaxID=1073089 RepID=A0A1L9RT50_ASPWE|nr:uncharacterized protein ASPWEDRAFT_307610 [Aspergillus wentii DTO 134E9]OJJ38028.1 hypothetical protein ASPWEDRAFT_307610 [Aspergillus wentii DTO 134E9]
MVEATAKEHFKGPSRWGSNSRGRGVRAGEILGWTPSQPRLSEILPSIVDFQAAKSTIEMIISGRDSLTVKITP